MKKQTWKAAVSAAATPRRGSLLYTTRKALNGKPYAGNMREIRTYGLTRGKSHHAPQKLRFGGYIAEGNPKL